MKRGVRRAAVGITIALFACFGIGLFIYSKSNSVQGMPRALLKLAKRSLPMIMLRDFELLVNNSMVRVV